MGAGGPIGGSGEVRHRENDLSHAQAGQVSQLSFNGTGNVQFERLLGSDEISTLITPSGAIRVSNDTNATQRGYTLRFYGPGDTPGQDQPEVVRQARHSQLDANTFELRFTEERFNNEVPAGGSKVQTVYEEKKNDDLTSTWTILKGADVATLSSVAVENDFLKKTVIEKSREGLTVSYTHLTLPTKA